ncbi:unannotated protein [freshwater metagenome]|uniref:Unannotated protein n=1 Tax=freshwater metagenome TaxID=449393 RepID=A0A6J6JLV4_9ZZZZ
MRPSGLTPEASTMIKPAPPTALEPRCISCQVPGIPSWFSAEYMHIGEIQMRFLTSRLRSFIGSNSFGIGVPSFDN